MGVFSDETGARPAAFCGACGAPLEGDGSFCDSCGSPVLHAEGAALTDVLRTETGPPPPALEIPPAFPAAPALPAGTTGAATSVSTAFGAGLLSVIALTAIVHALATVRAADSYLVAFTDLAFTIPILGGIVAGLLVGTRRARGQSGGDLALGAAAAVLALGALVFVSVKSGGFLDVATSAGFYALATARGYGEATGVILMSVTALAAAVVGWKAGCSNRRIAAAVVSAAVVVLGLSVPTLWRIYEMVSSLGRVR